MTTSEELEEIMYMTTSNRQINIIEQIREKQNHWGIIIYRQFDGGSYWKIEHKPINKYKWKFAIS